MIESTRRRAVPVTERRLSSAVIAIDVPRVKRGGGGGGQDAESRRRTKSEPPLGRSAVITTRRSLQRAATIAVAPTKVSLTYYYNSSQKTGVTLQFSWIK